MSADLIAELRGGPKAAYELAQALGITTNAVGCRVRRANDAGHRIVTVRGRAGRRGAFYLLLHDHDNPTPRCCAFGGCNTILSESNETSWCRVHQADLAYIACLERLNEVLDELMTERDGQLGLFEGAAAS